MLLGLETFSYHLAFGYGEMDVFSFIDRCVSLGLDGVQLNVETDGRMGCLGSDDPGFLKEVRQHVENQGLYIELDTCGTNPEHLSKMIHICRQVGADRLRTFSSLGGDVTAELEKAKYDFPKVMDLCAASGVTIAFENHEFESSRDIMAVVRHVNSPYLGTHIDVGNSMMVWEEPLVATANMAPVAASTHFKDHMVVRVGSDLMVAGVPLGTGSIDLKACYDILQRQSPLDRLNIEVCYGYVAPFRVSVDKGWGGRPGVGGFRIAEPPYQPEIVAPFLLDAFAQGASLNSFAWQELAQVALKRSDRDRLLELQDQAVITSVAYVKGLRDEKASREKPA